VFLQNCRDGYKSNLRFCRRQEDHYQIVATVSQPFLSAPFPRSGKNSLLNPSPLQHYGDSSFLALEETISALPEGMVASRYVISYTILCPPKKRCPGRQYRRIPHRSSLFPRATFVAFRNVHHGWISLWILIFTHIPVRRGCKDAELKVSFPIEFFPIPLLCGLILHLHLIFL